MRERSTPRRAALDPDFELVRLKSKRSLKLSFHNYHPKFGASIRKIDYPPASIKPHRVYATVKPQSHLNAEKHSRSFQLSESLSEPLGGCTDNHTPIRQARTPATSTNSALATHYPTTRGFKYAELFSCPRYCHDRNPGYAYRASKARIIGGNPLIPCFYSLTGRLRRASGDAAEALTQAQSRHRARPPTRGPGQVRCTYHPRRGCVLSTGVHVSSLTVV